MSTPARSAAPRTARPASTRPARTSTARAGSARGTATRPTTGRAASRPRRPALTAAPAPRPSVAGNGVFALVVIGILLTGMVMLLVLNTTLAQGAFEIGSLTKTQNQLAVTEQQLLQAVAAEEAPEALQRRATALGMVPVTSPVFLRLADGAVLGTPTAAAAARKRATTTTTTTATTTTKPAATSPTSPMTAVPVTTPTTAKAAATKTTKATKATPTTTKKGAAPTSDAAVPDPASGATR